MIWESSGRCCARVVFRGEEWCFVSREKAERRRGLKESGPSSPLGSSNDAGWKTRVLLSLFFDDLLDAKMRKFNPRYSEVGCCPAAAGFRFLHTEIYGNREFIEHLRNRDKFFDHTEKSGKFHDLFGTLLHELMTAKIQVNQSA